MFLELLFNPGETICVTDCKGGYHSVEQSAMDSEVVLISPKEGKKPRKTTPDRIIQVCINPIKGWSRDKDVTAYRTFLIELDEGSLPEQMKYIEDIGLPYSVCVFSGNKSLHFGITLDKDLLTEAHWKFTNEWILNILTKADQQCKNPSRKIRFPDNQRRDGAQKIQSLVKIKGRVSKNELFKWLKKFPDCEPKPKKEMPKNRKAIPNTFDIPKWIVDELKAGVTYNRNGTFFKIAIKLVEIGFNREFIKELLWNSVVDDFPEKEMDTLIDSAINKKLGD